MEIHSGIDLSAQMHNLQIHADLAFSQNEMSCEAASFFCLQLLLYWEHAYYALKCCLDGPQYIIKQSYSFWCTLYMLKCLQYLFEAWKRVIENQTARIVIAYCKSYWLCLCYWVIHDLYVRWSDNQTRGWFRGFTFCIFNIWFELANIHPGFLRWFIDFLDFFKISF